MIVPKTSSSNYIKFLGLHEGSKLNFFSSYAKDAKARIVLMELKIIVHLTYKK